MMRTVTACGVCGGGRLETLWELPRLPLTERFGPFRADYAQTLAYDQSWLCCGQCGHVQLGRQLDPTVLYTQTEYAFRTGASQSAKSGTAFFLDVLHRVRDGRQFRSLVDVGGNDRYLADQLATVAQARSVIDPIAAADDGRTIDGVTIFGRMVEAVDLAAEAGRPDLILCRHTLEHVAQPRAVLTQLLAQSDPEALFLFEIPCLENLVEGFRFDAIFHQHYQYYDLEAFRRLLWECGAEYLTHAFNHQGSCGGALVVAFRRAATRGTPPPLDLRRRRDWLQGRLTSYREFMTIQRRLYAELPRPIYGYGASLMLATLAYHLQTEFRELDAILDDDAAKDGWTYENVPVTVRHPGRTTPATNGSYVVTSLENLRPIIRRLSDWQPRRILVPAII